MNNSELSLVKFREPQLAELMSWITSKSLCQEWGSPEFRYPFDMQSFSEDSRWREIPTFGLQGNRDHKQLRAFGQIYDRLGHCHMSRLIVSPQQRGRGLGKLLIRQLVAQGKADFGFEKCSLFVLQNNLPALALYKKLGFKLREYPEQIDWLSGCHYMVAPVSEIIGD